jgi:L-iditol 2-dehydrogenase
MATMQALVKTAKGVGNIELQQRPVPAVTRGDDVLIEVKAAGICGTDIHILHDNFPYWPPVILGHEFSGQVVDVGPEVTTVKVGDRVIGEPHTKACGKCYLCRTGNRQICPAKRSPGWGIDGAFARYLVMPDVLLHRIPDTMSYDEAALVEPSANVVQDVLLRSRVEAGDVVVVTGPGPIGLVAAMCARAGGAKAVVIVGTDKDEELRLPTARKLGFEHAVNVQRSDVATLVGDLSGGRGADMVVEASGAEPAINQAVSLIRKQGRVCVIGMTGRKTIHFAWDAAIFKDCRIDFHISTGYECWDRTIALMASGQIDVKPLITHREPLANWKQVFDDVEHQRGLKALLIP